MSDEDFMLGYAVGYNSKSSGGGGGGDFSKYTILKRYRFVGTEYGLATLEPITMPDYSSYHIDGIDITHMTTANFVPTPTSYWMGLIYGILKKNVLVGVFLRDAISINTGYKNATNEPPYSNWIKTREQTLVITNMSMDVIPTVFTDFEGNQHQEFKINHKYTSKFKNTYYNDDGSVQSVSYSSENTRNFPVLRRYCDENLKLNPPRIWLNTSSDYGRISSYFNNNMTDADFVGGLQAFANCTDIVEY